MSRRALALLVGLIAVLTSLVVPAVALAADTVVRVTVPAGSAPDRPLAVTVDLPSSVAAVEGRVLFDRASAELIGVAPVGPGAAFAPVDISDGVAFGAYGLRTAGAHTTLRLVIVPSVVGKVDVRVVVDAAAGADGRRVKLTGTDKVVTASVGTGSRHAFAPPSPGRRAPTRPARGPRDVRADGRIDKADLNTVRAAWESTRALDTACDASIAGDAGLAAADSNADGCIDVVDLQAVLARDGQQTASEPARSIAAVGQTFVVTSAADTPDAAPGDGTCANALGLCTLRAAMMEADWLAGDDRIHFNLPGTAPVLIQLSTARMPIITSRNGTVVIDGYTQPGSRPNDATVGSNAIPGVEIRGNGNSAREVAFRVYSAGNTIRGLLIHNSWRSVVLDTPDAHDNYVVGNWMGFTRTGALSTKGQFAVVMNTGANHNFIGTPDLADRNVIGNHTHAVESFGPGVDFNTVQNNLMCIRPSGLSTARCDNGIDHNFGPKNSLIGGTGPNERNIIGPTVLQCVEFSHGWDPSGNDTSATYEINGHRVIGNWVGFRGDGSYDPLFRCGLNDSGSDNAQGINVYDGSNDNLIEGNTVGSVYDGIQFNSSNATGNIARGNVIGISPLGQAAPLARWGVMVRGGTRFDVVEGNTIANATRGGIGLLNTFNDGDPAAVAYNIRISRNIVTNTNGPAIDLFPGAGPNANDPGDGDDGANTLLNTPVFTTATASLIAGIAQGGSTVEVFRASRPAGEFGLPTEHLGTATVAPNGTWSLAVGLQAGDRVTAAQIASDGNTSELAANVAVADAPPPPEPGDVLASDDFGRTVATGWGTAPEGGAWATTGSAASYSVGSGTGRVSIGAGQAREATLAVAAADVVVTGQVAFDRVPAAGSAFAYVLARTNGTSGYRAQLRAASNGNVFLQLRRAINGAESTVANEVAVPGLNASGGAAIAFRLEVVGDQLRLRAWDAAGAEPSTWQTTATDTSLSAAGAAGLRGYVGGSVPNGPVTVSLDDFEVRRP